MSVRDTQARLATPVEEVIVSADAGQLACLAAIDDADYIIQDEVVLKNGVTEAASLSFDLFKDCDLPEKLATVLYGSRPDVVLIGEMTEYDKIQNAIKGLLTDLPMLGRFVAILLEPVSEDDDKPSFLSRALALNSNLPFGCDKLQMADRSLMHIRTHGRFDVWIASSTRDSRNLSPPPTYKLLRLMTPGAEVDKVVFHEPDVRDNQYTIQVNDLINGLLGSIGLNSDEVHLLPGTDPRNSKLFFTAPLWKAFGRSCYLRPMNCCCEFWVGLILRMEESILHACRTLGIHWQVVVLWHWQPPRRLFPLEP